MKRNIIEILNQTKNASNGIIDEWQISNILEKSGAIESDTEIDLMNAKSHQGDSELLSNLIYVLLRSELHLKFCYGEYILSKKELYSFFIQEIKIDSLEKLMSLLAEDNNNKYYRGEAQEFPDPFCSSLKRSHWDSSTYAENFEKYRRNAKLFTVQKGEEKSVKDARENEAHAQHYGFPTTYIDLTRKLGVALFFAMDSDFTGKDLVIYSIPRSIATNVDDGEDIKSGEFAFYTPQFIDKRIEAQQGLFISLFDKEDNPLRSISVIRAWVENQENIKKFVIRQGN